MTVLFSSGMTSCLKVRRKVFSVQMCFHERCKLGKDCDEALFSVPGRRGQRSAVNAPQARSLLLDLFLHPLTTPTQLSLILYKFLAALLGIV